MTPPGIDHGTVRLVAQRLNHYATPGPYYFNYLHLFLFLIREGIASNLDPESFSLETFVRLRSMDMGASKQIFLECFIQNYSTPNAFREAYFDRQ